MGDLANLYWTRKSITTSETSCEEKEQKKKCKFIVEITTKRFYANATPSELITASSIVLLCTEAGTDTHTTMK